ncbi:hypothetical protein C8J57DRAFT_1578472, partial [Mycena rebaudengoi]
ARDSSSQRIELCTAIFLALGLQASSHRFFFSSFKLQVIGSAKGRGAQDCLQNVIFIQEVRRDMARVGWYAYRRGGGDVGRVAIGEMAAAPTASVRLCARKVVPGDANWTRGAAQRRDLPLGSRSHIHTSAPHPASGPAPHGAEWCARNRKGGEDRRGRDAMRCELDEAGGATDVGGWEEERAAAAARVALPTSACAQGAANCTQERAQAGPSGLNVGSGVIYFES